VGDDDDIYILFSLISPCGVFSTQGLSEESPEVTPYLEILSYSTFIETGFDFVFSLPVIFSVLVLFQMQKRMRGFAISVMQAIHLFIYLQIRYY